MKLTTFNQQSSTELSTPSGYSEDRSELSETLNQFINELRPQHVRALTNKPLTPEETQDVLRHSQRFLADMEKSQAGLSDSTWYRLQSKWNLFVKYCDNQGVAPLPVSMSALEDFIMYRLETVAIGTVRGDAWAIDAIHHAAGFQKPCSDVAIQNLFTRKKSLNAADEVRQRQATSLTKEDLIAISEAYAGSDKTRDLRDLAAINLSFSCLLRCSELRRVKVRHINLESKTLEIPYTKVNKSGEPEYAPISDFTLKCIRNYCRSAGIDLLATDNQYLFRSVNRHNKVDVTKMRAISYETVKRMYLRAFDLCKTEGETRRPFTSHSCRVGACQELWKQGVELTKILSLGRWSTTEIAYRYGRAYSQTNQVTNDVLSPF